MIKLDISPRASVIIVGPNSPEWVISYSGSIIGGYIPVGLYPSLRNEDYAFIVDNAEAEVVVCSD